MKAINLVAVLAGSLAAAPGAQADPLTAYRWTSRVLLVFAPDATDARLAQQRRIMAAAQAGMGERDLVLVEALGSAPEALALRKRYELPPDAFRAVLVGKDGGAKLSAAEPIPARVLFSTVDAMPMRRDEMRR